MKPYEPKMKPKEIKESAWIKVAEATGEVAFALLKGMGAALVAHQEMKDALQDDIIKMKNEKAEMEYNNKAILKDDINNLRNHVLRIVKEDNSWFGPTYEGKRLLTTEHNRSEEENKQVFYKFIIEHGI